MGPKLGLPIGPWARVHYGLKLGPPVAHDGPDHAEGPLWAPSLGSPWARLHYGPKLGPPVAHDGPDHAEGPLWTPNLGSPWPGSIMGPNLGLLWPMMGPIMPRAHYGPQTWAPHGPGSITGPNLGLPVAHDGPDHAEGPLWAQNLGSPWARVHYGPNQGPLWAQTWDPPGAHMTPIFGPMGPCGPKYAPGAGPYGTPTILTIARTYGTILTIAPQKVLQAPRRMRKRSCKVVMLYKCANEAAK
jgi:hypothetical protein